VLKTSAAKTSSGTKNQPPQRSTPSKSRNTNMTMKNKIHKSNNKKIEVIRGGRNGD
jgi:hypothetical protein